MDTNVRLTRILETGAVLAVLLATAGAQEATLPQPAPLRPREQYRPGMTYDSLQAGQDAYRAAEADRQAAIQRQLRIQDEIRWYNTWAPGYESWPTLPEIYAYGARRAFRPTYRYGNAGYYGPLFEPWPRVPGDIYGYPYYGSVRQPTGHEKIWTSPNGYIYRPTYDPPPHAEFQTRRSAEPTVPRVLRPVPPAPVPHIPGESSPSQRELPLRQLPANPLPVPPAEPGTPREL
jgi:hypothetical protein